jgi:hypothetical protein
MKAMIMAVGARKPALLVAALIMALAMMGCAGHLGPLASHGTDQESTFGGAPISFNAGGNG